MSIVYCDYFGGVAAVKKRIVDAIKSIREANGLTHEEFDKFFGLDRVSVNPKYPSCRDIEEDPQRLNSNAVSIISMGLSLHLQDLFPIDEVAQRPDVIEAVVAEMKQKNAGLVGGGPPGTTMEMQVGIMILCSLQSELDTDYLETVPRPPAKA